MCGVSGVCLLCRCLAKVERNIMKEVLGTNEFEDVGSGHDGAVHMNVHGSLCVCRI